MHNRLPRRTFLRGLGTAVALPMLDAMLPAGALAAGPAKKQAPLRMAFLYVPNGKHMADWTPKAEGPGFELPYILEPLRGVKDDLVVMTGLTHNNARALGDGGGDHARAVSSFLTGVHPKKTDGADIKAGISVDQLAAQYLGRETRFPSLELGCERGAQAGNCDSGYSCAYSSNVSWRSETTPMAKEVDPRLVFERLFGTGEKKETDEVRARRLRYNKSILDFVLEDASQLKNNLGARDQRKLDEYLSSIRDVEVRIARAEMQTREIAGFNKPEGVPQEYDQHIRLMCDLLALAFQTDQTRIATFMLANDGSNRPYRNLNIPEGHHDLSHHGGDAEKHKKIREINRFHVSHFAYLAEKLKAIREGDGTLLDNCMLVYGCAISDGNRHNHDDLPILLAARAGRRIKTGRHVRYPGETPMTNLYLNMFDYMGLKVERFGDSTGRLDQLI
jgi:hypothetical protein